MQTITFILILISVTHIALDAISDALKDTTGKTIHWMQSCMTLLLMIPFYLLYWFPLDPLFIVYFILLRFVFFDTIYNDAAGHDLNYRGSTNHWWAKWTKKIPDWLMVSLQIIVFMLTFYLGYISNKYLIN